MSLAKQLWRCDDVRRIAAGIGGAAGALRAVLLLNAMKSKKSAFANTSTGYGHKHKHSGHGKVHGHKEKVEDRNKQGKDQQKPEQKDEQDKDLNSGFGDYLRTPEAFEMMKLFIFTNTIMVILTMAWPNVTKLFYMLNEWWESFREQQQ